MGVAAKHREFLASLGSSGAVPSTSMLHADRGSPLHPAPPPIPPGGIIQLWPLAHVGGAERAMLSVLKATPDLPWRGVALLSPSNHPDMLRELRRHVAVVEGIEESRDLISRADIVVAWWAEDFVTHLPKKGGARPTTIMVSHSPGGSPSAMRIMADDAGIDRYVAVSEAAMAPIPEGRRAAAVVIPNAIDVERLAVTRTRSEMLDAWGLPPDAKILGGLNRLSSEKRTERLVDAVALLPPEWYGVVIGDGYDRAAVEAHVDAVAPGRVILPGSRMDVGNVLNAFDALLVASEYESFCLTMAEALYAGVPVLATPVGIAAEHPGLARMLPADPDGAAIAAALLEDQEDGPSRRARVARAAAAARSLWSPEGFGREWSRFLRGMLEGKPESAAPASAAATVGPLVPLVPPVPPVGPTFEAIHARHMRGRAGAAVSGALALMARARACPDRGCKTGCQTSRCRRLGRDVTLGQCAACVELADGAELGGGEGTGRRHGPG